MSIFNKEKKYILFYDKKKYTEKELLKDVLPDAVPGVLIHKEVNYFYENILNIEERNLVEEYYRKPSEGMNEGITFNYLDYVPFIQIIGNGLPSYLSGLWTSLMPYDIYRAEFVAYEIIFKYNVTGYELAKIHNGLANVAYSSNADERTLEFVARHGLKAYELKDYYFKNDDCIRLDFFWSTLCNVLKKLNRLDEAIEIATFAANNDAYDKTKGGWPARLEKLIKAKEKSSK